MKRKRKRVFKLRWRAEREKEREREIDILIMHRMATDFRERDIAGSGIQDGEERGQISARKLIYSKKKINNRDP